MSSIDHTLLPVFALPMVAFPGEPILLHIFEPRYREMIADCRKRVAEGELGEFAISLLVEDEASTVATTVRLDKILKEYPDGRMDLVAKGNRRVSLGDLVEGASYRRARATTLPDEDLDWDEDLATRVFQAYGQVIRLVTGHDLEEENFSGKPVLSYYLIPTCGLSTTEQQHLLELTSENDRLAYLRVHLERLVESMPPVLEAVRSIHTNWHVRKEFEG